MQEQARLAQKIHQHYRFECFGPDGKLKWVEELDNLVVTAGMNDILDKYYGGSNYTAAHYVGLKGAGTVAAGDTAASHAGWSEVTAYSESVRQTLTMAAASGGSKDNSASKATFSMNGAYTVAGAFVITDSTKGGTSGVLVGAGDFSASRSGGPGDTIQVTITASLS